MKALGLRVSEKIFFFYVFPIVSLWELSVAMETRGLIRPGPKPNATFPLPQWCFRSNLISIGLVVLEIFKFENVNGRTDAHTHPRTDAGSTTIL